MSPRVEFGVSLTQVFLYPSLPMGRVVWTVCPQVVDRPGGIGLNRPETPCPLGGKAIIWTLWPPATQPQPLVL